MGLGGLILESWTVVGWLVFISNSWCDSGSCEVSVLSGDELRLWELRLWIMILDSWVGVVGCVCCDSWGWLGLVVICLWLWLGIEYGVILILGFGSRQTAVMLGVWIVIDCCNGDLGLLVVSVWVWFLRWVVILVWGFWGWVDDCDVIMAFGFGCLGWLVG